MLFYLLMECLPTQTSCLSGGRRRTNVCVVLRSESSRFYSGQSIACAYIAHIVRMSVGLSVCNLAGFSNPTRQGVAGSRS